jgi:hypothetical protein
MAMEMDVCLRPLAPVDVGKRLLEWASCRVDCVVEGRWDHDLLRAREVSSL